MASQSQSTCVEQRDLVRSSSSWRCGSWRLQNEHSCRVCACTGCARQPGANGGLTVAEDSLSGEIGSSPSASAVSTMARLPGGSFQTVQEGVASGSERHVASRASKRLEALGMAMRTIPDQGVDMSICDPGVLGNTGTTGWDRRSPLCLIALGLLAGF
jgi:hypothetical protein